MSNFINKNFHILFVWKMFKTVDFLSKGNHCKCCTNHSLI